MVHSAYDTFELLTGCPTKIDAVESHGSKLLLACSDGSLRIYAPESDRSPPPSSPADRTHEALRKEPYVLERTVNAFSKRPMVAMEASGSRELLLSLSESIAFHRLPNLETIAVITKAKGANAYAWDDRRGFLCFARQKRICIFRHDGGRGFVEVKEFGVPDTVKSMAWCGENICLGIKREYVILNSTNGALSEVFPSGRIAPPLVVCLPSGELLLGKIRSLRVPYPLIQTVVLRNVRHLLQTNYALIVALDNSVCGLFPIPLGAQKLLGNWFDALGCGIATSINAVLTMVHLDLCLLVTAMALLSLWSLWTLPVIAACLMHAIVQLTASGNFEEALALCRMLPQEDSSLRAAKEQSIHIRYAHYLFENGSYEEAMEHFLASQVEITHVLSFYPSIALPKSIVVPEAEKFMDISGDNPYLSRGSSGLSDDMEYSPPPQLLETDEGAALESKKMSHNTLMALIKFLQKKRYGIIEKATAEGTEEVVSDAVGDTFISYDSNRSKKSAKGRLNMAISSGAREIAAVLDTALLQALVLTGQSSAAVELLKTVNYCEVKICEEFLQKRNHYDALLELYKCNAMHHEALKLLHQLIEESKSDQAQAELRQKFKPEMIIDYLKPLCGTDTMLVLEYAMLVLDSCPTQTIDLFLSGNVPADLVNVYLKQHAPSMQATYLELMLAMNENGISGNLQNEMVQIYLSEVLDWYTDLSAQQAWDEKAYSPTRKKLLSALESISGYNPEALLKRLPADALYEERAILLGKMNQHELALSIYVHKLHLPELALSYCDRVYESASAKSYSTIYLTLLQIYLNPRRTTKNFEKRIINMVSTPNSSVLKAGLWSSAKSKVSRPARKIAEIEGAEDVRFSPGSTDSGRSDGDADTDDLIEEAGSSIMLDEVLDLLSRRWDRVNGAQALKLLPKDTKLQNLLPFLGPLLRKSSEAFRNFSVIKSLRESENLQVKDELCNQRKTVVKIMGDSMCALCNKKIGTSVFAVYPNGKTLVHFVCFKDSQNMKAVVKGTPRRQR
ncbi:hypothetical protein C3L33_15810, partial [Rhododendron williamsianum]